MRAQQDNWWLDQWSEVVYLEVVTVGSVFV